MSLLASTLPSNDGYVAAAYIVFFALLLVYLAIMGVRLSRMERRLRELQERRDTVGADRAGAVPRGESETAPKGERAAGETREREVV